MNASKIDQIVPDRLYSGVDAIALTGIPERTFYRYVRLGRIPKHELELNHKTVYLGRELLAAVTTTRKKLPLVYFVRPKRGRPRKNG